MSDQELSRLKNAFINQYKVDKAADEVIIEPEAPIQSSDELDYDFTDSKLKTFAPSLIISVLVIVVAIVIFSGKKTSSSGTSLDTQNQVIEQSDKSLVDAALEFESITYLKAKFFDGVESYDLSLPLTLQESENRNVIIDLDETISLSKRKLILDLELAEGTIELFLKDSSLQSNRFNPFVIKSSQNKQIVEISVSSLPNNMIEDVNLYRIKEIRLNLNKAKTVSINSITLQ